MVTYFLQQDYTYFNMATPPNNDTPFGAVPPLYFKQLQIGIKITEVKVYTYTVKFLFIQM